MDREHHEQEILNQQRQRLATPGELLDKYKKPAQSGPNSERTYWVDLCAQLTGKPFKQMAGLLGHLPTPWIRDLYDKSKEGRNQRAFFWYLLKQTRK